jgi:nucleolar complex protein 2
LWIPVDYGIGLTNFLFPTSVIVGTESSAFSRRLSEAQKQQDELDDDEGTIAFSKNLLAEKKKLKYVPTFFSFLHSFSGSLWKAHLYASSGCRIVKENKKRVREHDDDEDLVEDLVLSSDEENEGNDQESDVDGSVPVEDDSDEDFVDPDSEFKKQQKAKLKRRNKRQPVSKAPSKMKRKPHPKKKAKH